MRFKRQNAPSFVFLKFPARKPHLAHKRSNVESTFSMMKRKFGDSIRSKTDVAMVNEVLCKVLCHNLVALIHEMYELGIEPVFWKRETVQ